MSPWTRLSRRTIPALASIVVLAAVSQPLAAQPYDPYAEAQQMFAPVAPDGTIRWGTYYKSAAMQKAYERLWSLGACRGTNKAITVPVTSNKLVIDNLPEESFTGLVRGAAGGLAGGVVAFSEGEEQNPATEILVAQLHPAGVTDLRVEGRAALAALRPGMTVRIRATVDERGRATEPLRSVEIVTPPHGFVPDDVRPRVRENIVGTIVQARYNLLQLKVDAGRIRRITVPVEETTEVMVVDAAQVDLIAPGDRVEITGRRWSGEGSMAAGTVFASRVIVHKGSGETPPTEDGPPAKKPS